jgi:serine/threonine protein kinase/WD40 repeat protein
LPFTLDCAQIFLRLLLWFYALEGRVWNSLMIDPPDREVAVFSAARLLPAGQRAAYLDEACAGDAALRQLVEALLEAHEEAGEFLENPAPGAEPTPAAGPQSLRAASATTSASGEKAGDRIGRYKLLQQIGEGGCGVVYMAEQEEPVRRQVALKVIKLGMDTKSVIARFEAERQALALMDHPNIAKVLDAGTTETGRPYFVMELIRGIKITDYCDQHNLSTRQRLDLFVQVCQAIQHAHQKGVIHRDIKPSNILVTLRDGVPVPKVIDFGIAKATTDQRLTDKTLFTAFQQFIGTPAYMSPEQAEMSELGIDTRSDIYSLGVLLYELLTGQTPFDAKELLQAGLDAMRRIIREQEPARPSTRLSTLLEAERTSVASHRQTDALKLIHLVRGDLDWIVMKSLEKDRTRRYETANGLAADIRRHLNSEPVVASPPGNLYRLQKLVRRNRLATFALLAILLSLLAGLVATNYFRFKERQVLHGALLAEARAHRISGHAGQRFDSLQAVIKAAAIRRDAAARDAAIAALALTDLRWIKLKQLPRGIRQGLFRFDTPMLQYAIAEANGSVAIRAVADDRLIAELSARGYTPVDLAGFSSDSRYLKVRYLDSRDHETERVWDVTNQTPVLKDLPGESVDVQASRFSPDSRFLSRSSLNGILTIYDLSAGREVKHLNLGQGFDQAFLSPDNTLLAATSNGVPRVEIRELVTGSNVLTLACPAPVTEMAWSFDSKQLAVACEDRRIYLWAAEKGTLLGVLEGHLGRITDLAFNHAGDLLASTGWDGVIRLWNPDSGKTIADVPLGSGGHLEFTRDDRFLGPVYEGTSQFGSLEVAHGGEYRRLWNRFAKSEFIPYTLDFSADGRIIAGGTEGHVCFWAADAGKEIGSLPTKKSLSRIFHPDGQRFFFSELSAGVLACSLEKVDGGNSMTYRLGPPQTLFAGEGFREANLSRDGRYLAVVHFEGDEGFVFDLQHPSSRVVLSGHPKMDYIALSPDGRWAASGSWQNALVKIWDARTGDCLRTNHMPARTRITFSPDGQWLATASLEYQLWKTGTWQPVGAAISGYHIPEWNSLAFNSDGHLMAITQDRNRIQLRETASGKVLATLQSPDSISLWYLRFSPDDTRLAAGRNDGQLELWDLRLIRQELAQLNLDWNLPPYPAVEQASAEKSVTLEVEADPATSPAPAK